MRGNIAGFSCALQPFYRVGCAFTSAYSSQKAIPQIALGVDIALKSRPPIPTNSLLGIDGSANSIYEAVSQIVLRYGVSSQSRLLIPMHCKSVIFFYAYAVEIADSYIIHGLYISGFGGFQNPLGALYRIGAGNSGTLNISQSYCKLRRGISRVRGFFIPFYCRKFVRMPGHSLHVKYGKIVLGYCVACVGSLYEQFLRLF